MAKLVLSMQVEKFSSELGIIWGYASVADIVDLQDEIVPQAELVTAVYQFLEDYYRGAAQIKDMHQTEAEAVLVESTFHFLAGVLRWYVGVKLLSEELLQDARDGKISGFSIGGQAQKVNNG